MDLSALQQRVRKDPGAYHGEFARQVTHLRAQLSVFDLQPDSLSGTIGKTSSSFVPQGTSSSSSKGKLQKIEAAQQQSAEAKIDRDAVKNLRDLVMFVAQCSDVYPGGEAKGIGGLLVGLLERAGGNMNREVRQSLVSALMVLRAKNAVQPLEVLPVFFRLLQCGDRDLRASLRGHIVADVRACNSRRQDNRLNNALQGFLFSVVSANDSDLGSKMAVDILIDLYKKNVWHDAKTVNAISKGVFSHSSKVVTAVLRFFLGEKLGKSENDSDDSADEKAGAFMTQRARLMSDANHMMKNGSKNTGGKKRKHGRALKLAEKLREKAERIDEPTGKVNWPALELVYDPQSYAEKCFAVLRGSNDRFEVRLMLMNLISRLVGVHKLDLPNFYPFLQRYLRPKQEHITYVMVSLAQAVHENVLPETLEPVIRCIADNFVADRCAPEAVAAGLNTVREIITRNPLAIADDDPAGLIRDFTAHTHHRDKNVVQAARALINLFRSINPGLLKRKDRGKPNASGVSSASLRPLQFGERIVASSVDGIELLEMLDQYKREHGDMDDAQIWTALTGEALPAGGPDGEGSSDSDSEDGWIDVASDDSDDSGSSGDWESASGSSDAEVAEERQQHEQQSDHAELKSDSSAESGAERCLENSDDAEMPPSDTIALPRDLSELSPVPIVRLDQTRILTEDDIERLRRLKKLQAQGALGGNKASRKRGVHSLATVQPGLAGVVIDMGSIEGARKRQRMTYEERIAHMAVDRDDDTAFSRAAKRSEYKGGGSSNLAKKKTKAFTMIKHKRSVREKLSRGTNEKNHAKEARKTKGRNKK